MPPIAADAALMPSHLMPGFSATPASAMPELIAYMTHASHAAILILYAADTPDTLLMMMMPLML